MILRYLFSLLILLLSLSTLPSFAKTVDADASSVKLFATFCQTSTAVDGDSEEIKKKLEEEEEEEPDCD